MHILVVQSTANSTTFGWERGFEELGHRVTVITATAKRQFGGRPGAVIHVVPDTMWSRWLAERSQLFHRLVDVLPSGRQVRAAIRTLRPDIAIVRADKGRNLVLGRGLSRSGVPWVLWQEQLPPLSRRWRAAKALGVRPVASFTALDSRPGGVAQPVAETPMPRVSYTPYLTADPTPTSRPASRPVRILVVASFKNHTAKHQWTVLEAAAEVGLIDGSATFTFSGQGGSGHEGYRRVLDTARALDIEGLIDLRPNVPFDGMGDLYRSHDLLVLPSVREQFGMAIVEAMAHGLPTVCSDAVGAIGCVVHGETGLVFPVSDRAALGQAMRRLVDDPDLRDRLGRGARGFVAAHLDSRCTAERILRLAGGGAEVAPR